MKEVPKLDISQFVSLKKMETGEFCDNLNMATQSIAHFELYCQFHFYELLEVATPQALRLERVGINTNNRIVYEAHIVAFMNNLHSMLDSFPYVLNLFIPKFDVDSKTVGWNKSFIKRYKEFDFYHPLLSFFLDSDFNKVKGYVNNIKHKHLIRIANLDGCLEFETYKCKFPYLCEGNIDYSIAEVKRDNVIIFIQGCFNRLIDKFFSLCKMILEYKKTKLAL
ncbi:hypothetical protein [Vibrio vulnificus]|uniref:hypothetical protein n=1 Tax=Vibrio vulnificus TaxID=672 RepID=UPI0007226BAC|nr:hypothetical protein [Vibrio vulnificus]ALM70803.1 hypothetical protein FORC9_1286 [Vibrio vulnificus]ALM70817.1 hypothetical protein FORC9_1300 [Vibrio vulnificus]ANH63376.1 hypothetical protein FORC16_1493 [Vibrio vulnificus]ANH63390.1 hypothetical protein FORC16_1507 [Vibrio vulnificus]